MMRIASLLTTKKWLSLGVFFVITLPSFYIYTNCAVVDKVADIWESDPLSSRHKDIALKVLRKYRKLYVDIFPNFVIGAKSNIYLGRAGNTNQKAYHYDQVLDCIDDAIDAYNEESGSANLYYFNDDDRIWGIDNDEGATASAEGNAIFIPEWLYEEAIDNYVDAPYVVDGSFLLFQTLIHEFNHWNGISHQNEMQASHQNFVDFTTKDRERQLEQFYKYSDSTYYFDAGPIQTISQILRPYSDGFNLSGSLYKEFKCSQACSEATTDYYNTFFPTVWNGSSELSWYGISQGEFNTLASTLCSSILIDSSSASDPMNVCSRESNIEAAILNFHSNLCSCAEIDDILLSQVKSIDISNQNVSSLSQSDFFGLGEDLTFIADNNQISSLSFELFAFVESTYSISINNNQITTMSPDTFSGLHGLTRLDLSGNQISSLSATRLFKDLNSLQALYLQNNNISSISTNIFNNLSSLSRLELNNNQLSNLPTDFFNLCSTSSSLTLIDLSNNNFSSDQIASYTATASSQCSGVVVRF